jgi:hypothetical protein
MYSPKGFSTSLEGCNFLPINWQELIEKCSESKERYCLVSIDENSWAGIYPAMGTIQAKG